MTSHATIATETIFVPVCTDHEQPWRGAPSRVRDHAVENCHIHDTDCHPVSDELLFHMEPTA